MTKPQVSIDCTKISVSEIIRLPVTGLDTSIFYRKIEIDCGDNGDGMSILCVCANEDGLEINSHQEVKS